VHIKNKFHVSKNNFFFLFLQKRAGTGKSTLIKEIVKKTCSGKEKKCGYKLYLINVDAKDTANYKKSFKQLKNINFEQLEFASKKSCIVVEDIIHITKKDEQQLRTAINYQAHHKTQKIICASHAIYKTQIFSLLGFFNFIIFTSSVANVPTLRNIFNYFKLEKSQILNWINLYKSIGNGKHGTYFFFDCEKMSFGYSKESLFKRKKIIGTVDDGREGNSPERSSNLEKIFNKFVENLPEKNEATSVFSIISNCVNPTYIRKQDLSITFMTTSGEKKAISLVDYIVSLLTPNAIVRPPLIVVHRFVRKFCNIPVCFVKNKNFENYTFFRAII
jgi:hypothetical protein